MKISAIKLLLISGFLWLVHISASEAQIRPAYQILDSLCMDQNQEMIEIKKVLSSQNDENLLETFSNLEVRLTPSEIKDDAPWTSAELGLEELGRDSMQGVLKLRSSKEDSEDSEEEIVIKKDRVIELLKKLKFVLENSDAFNMESTFLQPCREGFCRRGEFVELSDDRFQAPALENAQLILSIKNKDTEKVTSWDLSRSILERYRRHQYHQSRSPHKLFRKRCLFLQCSDQVEDFSTADQKFKDLYSSYEFFIRHFNILLKQSRPPEAAKIETPISE